MSESTAGSLFDDIATDIVTAWAQVGGEIQTEVKQDLSVPVEVRTGPRGGRIVIRSKLGEHPRRETGLLQGSVMGAVERHDLSISMFVFDPVFYAIFLDPGLDRPIIGGSSRFPSVADRFTDKVVDAVAAAISGTA